MRIQAEVFAVVAGLLLAAESPAQSPKMTASRPIDAWIAFQGMLIDEPRASDNASPLQGVYFAKKSVRAATAP